jgi:hypothetical protein
MDASRQGESDLAERDCVEDQPQGGGQPADLPSNLERIEL